MAVIGSAAGLLAAVVLVLARRKLPVRWQPSTSVGSPLRNTAQPPTNTAATASSLRLTIRDNPAYWSTVSSAVQRIVEVRRVDDDEVGAIADPQVAGIEVIPVGQFAGEPVHRLLYGHKRLARLFGVAHMAHQSQPEVVERHVA